MLSFHINLQSLEKLRRWELTKQVYNLGLQTIILVSYNVKNCDDDHDNNYFDLNTPKINRQENTAFTTLSSTNEQPIWTSQRKRKTTIKIK